MQINKVVWIFIKEISMFFTHYKLNNISISKAISKALIFIINIKGGGVIVHYNLMFSTNKMAI